VVLPLAYKLLHDRITYMGNFRIMRHLSSKPAKVNQAESFLMLMMQVTDYNYRGFCNYLSAMTHASLQQRNLYPYIHVLFQLHIPNKATGYQP
jgi:hypothetical protein